MCEMPLCSKHCKNCFALCLNRPEAAEYFKSLGGPKFSVNRKEDIYLPAHIPILPDKLKNISDLAAMPIVGVHGGNAFSRNGEKINPSYSRAGFQTALNLDQKTAGILEFYVRDRTLEGFWDNRQKIYNELKGLNFAAVIAPNYSVYEDAPRIDHMYNIKRSTIVYNEMIDKGINAIPDVSWFNIRDLEIWCEEINKNKIKNIAFSFQVVDVALKPSTIWRNYLTGFRYLCSNINQDIQIIIAGVVSPFRIQEIFKAARGQSLHILNQSAFIQSRKGMLSETREKNENLSFDELFYLNVKYFNELYSSMNDSFRGDSINNIFDKIFAWETDTLIKFYSDYENQKELLKAEFSIGEDLFSNVVSKVIERMARKKKIKYKENNPMGE